MTLKRAYRVAEIKGPGYNGQYRLSPPIDVPVGSRVHPVETAHIFRDYLQATVEANGDKMTNTLAGPGTPAELFAAIGYELITFHPSIEALGSRATAPTSKAKSVSECHAAAETLHLGTTLAAKRPFFDARAAEFTRKAVEALKTMDFEKFAVPGPLLAGGPEPKLSKRADDEETFNITMAYAGTAESEWEINVCYREADNRFVCDLYRMDDAEHDGVPYRQDTLVATSKPFKRCAAAVLWAHKFEVPVFVMADDLYPDDEED